MVSFFMLLAVLVQDKAHAEVPAVDILDPKFIDRNIRTSITFHVRSNMRQLLSSNQALALSALFVCIILSAPNTWAATYYVATNGSDSYNGLSPAYQSGTNGPFKTIGHGVAVLNAGDTLAIRAGVYQESVTVSASGTASLPILITNYADEKPVMDGVNNTVPTRDNGGALIYLTGDYITVRNLELRNSGASAVVITASAEHCTIDNIYMHHNWSGGAVLSGNYSTAQNVRAWYNSVVNDHGGSTSGGWGTGITCARYPYYCTIKNCTVWETWGEGISTYESHYTTIENNVSYNNQVNLYLSDTVGTVARRNLSYCTPGNVVEPYYFQNGLMMGDEKSNPPSSGNTVINNFVMGCKRNLGVGAEVLTNTLIANNTFVNSSTGGDYNLVFFAGTAGTNARFTNNIVLQESGNIAAIGASNIRFANNNWSKTPPSSGAGSGDIVSNPLLAKSGATGAGLLTGEYFKLTSSSPGRYRGLGLSEVVDDFFGNDRSSTPDIGGHEYDTTSAALQSPTGLRVVSVQ